MPAILELTDGTTVINLLQNGSFRLASWTPLLAQLKGGGSFQQSSISDGRQLTGAWFENVSEVFGLEARGFGQDTVIRGIQDLLRLLQKAREYFTTEWQTQPVWIRAKAADETNTRYAVVCDYRLPQLSNPYGQPFYGALGEVGFRDLSLAVERKHWQSTVPGTGDCVEVSGLAEEIMPTGMGNWTVTNVADDCDTDDGAGGTIRLNANEMIAGVDAGGDDNAMGIGFRNVTIPVGATILGAWVYGMARNNQANAVCNLRIYIEDNATPALPFTTYANFWGRARTTASMAWDAMPAWIAGTWYITPNIAAAVQEVIDLGGWVANNNLVVFVQDNGSDVAAVRDWETLDAGANQPILYVAWSDGTTANMGREATCLNEVYISNKHNEAQLTHAFRYPVGGPYSANLIGMATPFDLFPGGAAGPANNDITYFGVVDGDHGGPFCSLVFDIETAATYGPGDSVQWQYWSGAWQNLTVVDNTTSFTVCTQTLPFAYKTGVNSIHWEQPSGWVSCFVNGIWGYWVRAVITEATAIGRARQGNRNIYTILWANIAADSLQVQGDIPALLRLWVHGQSECAIAGSDNIDGYINRVLVGLRTANRGSDFRSFVNLADEQNPSSVLIGAVGGSAFALNSDAAAGRAINWVTNIIEPMLSRAAVVFSPCTDWWGRYHAFVRYKITSGSDGDFRMSLQPRIGFTTFRDTMIRDLYASGEWNFADFGMIDLPPMPQKLDASQVNAFEIRIRVEHILAVAGWLVMYDLVLVPADEWIGDFQENITPTSTEGQQIYWNEILDIDSLTIPALPIVSPIITPGPPPDTHAYYIPYIVQPAMLQANVDQRLYFFMARCDGGTTLPRYSEPYLSCSIQAFDTWRYLSLRGNR